MHDLCRNQRSLYCCRFSNISIFSDFHVVGTVSDLIKGNLSGCILPFKIRLMQKESSSNSSPVLRTMILKGTKTLKMNVF